MARHFLFSISSLVLFTSFFAISVSAACYREDGDHEALGSIFVCDFLRFLAKRIPGAGLIRRPLLTP